MYYLAQERYIKPQITINGSRQLLNSAVFAKQAKLALTAAE